MTQSDDSLQQAASVEHFASGQVSVAPRAFDCPACGGSVQLRTAGRAVTAICSNCSSVIDVANDDLKIVATAQSATRSTPLAIGARGKLDGILWEVVGYARKTDETGTYPWDEYLLFNPYHGFRFLSQEAGHWTLASVIKKNLVIRRSDTRLVFEKNEYKIFLRGISVVQYVQGEFYWRVRAGERWWTTEYICPPYLLSVEENGAGTEINFSLGRYVSRSEVIEAFKPETFLQWPSGVGACQPSPFDGKVWNLWKWAIGAVAAAFVLHLFLTPTGNGRQAYSESLSVQAVDKDKTYATRPFELQQSGAVQVVAYAPVNNDWVELNLALVEEGSNEQKTSFVPIEYYSGIDADGPWSEGAQIEETYFSTVHKGVYRLLIDTDAGAFARSAPAMARVQVTEGVSGSGSFVIALLLLLIPPIIQSWRQSYFEERRWRESDFRPDGSKGEA